MERDVVLLDALARHEIAVAVVDDLVAVDVAVVVGRGDAVGMVIEQPGHKRTNDEIMPLEHLVDRRRLVHAARDGLEVVDADGPRIEAAVPTHDVERMVVEHVPAERVAGLDQDLEFAGLGEGLEVDRRADVALAVGRMLQQLAELIPVALGRGDLAARLDDEEAAFLGVEAHAPGGAVGNDEVVAGIEVEPAELRLQRALALVHEPDLVGLGVAIEKVHALRRARHAEGDVVVAEKGPARRDRIAAVGHAFGGERAVADGAEGGVFDGLRLHELCLHDPRRQEVMVEDGLDAVKSLQAHQLLAVERAVGLAELGVPLVGDLAETVVVAHEENAGRGTRGSCTMRRERGDFKARKGIPASGCPW